MLANNVLYNPDTGFVIYLEDVRGVELYNNTIWGKHDGRYGGMAIGTNVAPERRLLRHDARGAAEHRRDRVAPSPRDRPWAGAARRPTSRP